MNQIHSSVTINHIVYVHGIDNGRFYIHCGIFSYADAGHRFSVRCYSWREALDIAIVLQPAKVSIVKSVTLK